MGVKNLIKLMQSKNIAKDLDDTELALIAADVLERANEDLASMKDWMDCVDEGLALCKPEFTPKSEPWDGSANYKSAILASAANDFGNRASIELMRDPKLVKAEIIGIDTLQNVINAKNDEVMRFKEQLDSMMAQATPEDQQVIAQIRQEINKRNQVIQEKKAAIKEKKNRADRVTEFMNWQVNVSMKEWRKDKKKMFYTLPNFGTVFNKTYYDSSLGRCITDIISYPNFIVNQATVSMDTCRSFTHIIDVSKAKCKARMKSGVWRKCELVYDGQPDDSMTNEKNGVLTASKNPDCFYEQYCWLDLDDDGIEEPYIVTVHKSSAQVVRIVARYDYDDIIVTYGDMKAMPLLDAQRKRSEKIIKESEELGTTPEIPDPYDLTGYEVVRIEPTGIITKYGFIPSQDNSYLDVGFFHLVGALTMAENKVTNDLLNSGTLANNQMGMTAKGFRKRQGDFKFKMGQLMATEIPAEQLQNSIYMLNFKEPSPTLFQLRESIRDSSFSFIQNADMAGQLQANTAPTTALAMIHEAQTQKTAHLGMIIDAMSEEFKIIYDLNGEYPDNDEYRKIVGDDEATFESDFSEDNLSIVCSADAEHSSKTQRMILAEAELAQAPLVMQAGGNPIPIIKNYYKAIGSADLDEYFPNEAEMSPTDRAQMQQMKQLQEQANQLKQAELELKAKEVEISNLQVALLARSEDRKDAEFELSKHKTLADIDSTLEDVNKKASETRLIDEQVKYTNVQTNSLMVKTDLDVAKTTHEINSKPIDNSSNDRELELIRNDAAKEMKALEVAGIVLSKDTKEKDVDVGAMIQANMDSIKQLAESIKPKSSKITISKQADGSYVGEKVVE